MWQTHLYNDHYQRLIQPLWPVTPLMRSCAAVGASDEASGHLHDRKCWRTINEPYEAAKAEPVRRLATSLHLILSLISVPVRSIQGNMVASDRWARPVYSALRPSQHGTVVCSFILVI